MADISVIKLPNGNSYNLKDTTARSVANSAVPNTRTVNGKALSSNISLGAGDVGAYTKSETDTKINAAVASTYKYKGSVTADKLPTSGQVVGDVYNITNDSSYGKAGMNVAWNGTTWDALGSNVDLSNYVTTSDSRLSNARPASDVYAWAKAAKKPSYSASEIGAAPASHTHTKDQVGLGNVANLDQSKAIKSITRSGTTFTATALDGTTTTFTQQDNNTTYGLASQSSNGLMSAADKSKLDGIGAGSNVKSVNGKTGVVNLSKADVGLGNVDNTSDANKAVFESRLRWGGTNIAGDISPIDAAMSNIHSANRAAFANPAGIIVEFSNDGGSTWTDYGASNASKIQLVSGIKTAYFIGKHTTNNTVTVNDKLRITVNASTCGFYTALKKILIEVSTNGAGGAYVELQKSYKSTETSWSPSERYSISGWSGWNSIPCNGAFGGGSNQTGNIANIRLTFGITSKRSSSDVNSLSVLGLQFLGTTYWGYHSEMAKSGHLYSYDAEQNASFPAQITAKQFNGTATNASKVNNHTVNSDVPSGAKFTDTTYGAATQSSPGLMSAADKKKLDGIGAGSNVKSVNSKTGAVTLTKSDIGLGNVDNTADSAKSVKYAASAGSANAVAWGNVSGKPSTYPPSSHTHTPAQVGLGNVANLDQSKAIKSITRSGTTFTATALDGTTTTFTQQDNNTTYGLASQSSNGLMSAADKKAIDREFFRMVPKGGTVIPNGANLNSTAYLKVGNYYQSANANTTNMTNIPSKVAFMMYVLSPLSEAYDDESTRTWVYRLRIFVEHTGSGIFTQLVSSGTTAGSFDYGPWVKMTNSNDLGAVSNTINTHIANKSNPHGVTKAQVGLGNVDNTADSAKSVKYATSAGSANSVAWGNVSGKPSSLPANGGNSSTVNGHTVNANVPSGAKFTDTTYSVATQSANGLMSAADKKKLDSYTTGSAGGAVEVTLAAASWSSSTTEINGNNYYTYSVSVANIGNQHPQIFCGGGDSVIPSATQESEFNHIRYALVDTAKSTVTFYSIEKPSVAINVVIKDYLESSIVSGTASVTIATSDWSSTTSTVNGRAFYTAKKTLSSVSSNYPTIICGTADTLPSDAEQTAFDCINYAAADTSTKTVTFYAIQKPTSAVVAIVI